MSASNSMLWIQWDMKSGEMNRDRKNHANNVTCVAVSPGGDWIVSGSKDRSLIELKTKSGETILCIRFDGGKYNEE